MKQISSVREAKDFLARRIAEEAKQEGSPLTDIERKMLYFSETDWTLPDMAEVSAAFDRDYDQDEYEQKIAGFVRNVTASADSWNLEEIEGWDEALMKLSEGDHYLLVLLNCAERDNHSTGTRLHGFLPTLHQDGPRPPHDRLKLWIFAFVAVFGVMGIMIFWDWLYMHSSPGFRSVSDWLFEDRDRTGFLGLLVVVALALGVKLKQIATLFFHRK